MQYERVTQTKDYDFTPEKVLQRLAPVFTNPEKIRLFESKLKGKTAIVTGSSRGIGEATARLFGEFGMNVVVSGRATSTEKGEAISHDINSHGGNAEWIPADITKHEEAEKLVEASVAKFGRIDVLVNNAGTKEDDLIVRMDKEKWYNVMRSNADSAFFMTQAVVKRMLKNKEPKGGMIVYVSSVGQEGFAGQVNYAASKRAMEAIADVTALEYSSREINTAILRVGLTDTELTSDLNEKQRQALIDMLPAHRAFKPSEIARGVAFLSQYSSSGHILTIA